MTVLGLDSPLKRCIFVGYVLLWVSSHLLIYASKRAGAPDFNATSVVLLTELIKLIMATSFYVTYDGSLAQMVQATRDSVPLLLKYAVPALLYCVYNNLVYINLSTFDPGTYNVLMQARIVMTGVLYQVLFTKRLSRNQWLGIVLITLGCMCKEADKLTSSASLSASVRAWLLLLASVFAGVYTELLLKGGDGGLARGVTTNLQNAYMYLHSIVWNGAFLMAQGRLSEAVAHENLAAICTPTILAIMAIMSSVGLVTGYFLKHLDSVLKNIAAATEVVLTMLASAALFGTELNETGLVAALLVAAGVALYARPVAPARPPLPAPDAAAVEEESQGLLRNEKDTSR
jgi:drug/metabolite transporter (DMT)-like permease